MVIAGPSLSSKGWVVETGNLMDLLFSYYTAANYHQTLLFKGNVYSLQKAAQECGSNMTMLATRMQTELTSIYGRAFDKDNVKVEVSIDETEYEWQQNAKINFFVSISVNVNGKTYDLQKVLANSNSVFKAFNNPGIAI